MKTHIKTKKGIPAILIGLVLLALALTLGVYNLYGEWRALQAVRETMRYLEYYLVDSVMHEDSEDIKTRAGKSMDANPDVKTSWDRKQERAEKDMPAVTVEDRDYIGIIAIPGYELELPVISEWSYSALKSAPCRYAGSAYAGDLVIAGHNYRAHFACLPELKEGEQVVFTDMEGNVFIYEVTGQEILNAEAVEEVKRGDWDLTLFTCTGDGSRRIVVRCRLL